ncbi:hypothetical protein [Leisingera daeponensis]|uniref:hypothetical protein n=1 Tax=Leisingera daeponensis TaxID=405746 RepID=UPI001C93A8D5|nr:hypothetical protein [Leisingera daeponensis]MBY6056350.1 hypothetical protein [Leisingera daeponensis]
MKSKYRHFSGKFLVNFPLGLLVGAEFVLVGAWLTEAGVVDKDDEFWKTAALLLGALVAPVFLVAVNFFQQAKQREREEEVRLNRLAAAKASLPGALSEFFHVCSARMQQLVGPDEDVKADELEVSKDTLSDIQACIEFERGDLQTGLAEILMIYQIMIARSKNRAKERRTKCFDDPDGKSLSKHQINIEELHHAGHIAHWASFSGVIEAHFDYARGIRNSVKRAEVGDFAFRRMSDLCDTHGVPLLHNKVFEKALETRKGKNFGFTDPSWKKVLE